VSANWAVRPTRSRHVVRVGGTIPRTRSCCKRRSQTLDALGDEPGGTACLERLLAGQDSDHFASVATGIRGYLTRHQLAGRYVKAGRLAEAEAQWRLALAEQPRYMPASIGLGTFHGAIVLADARPAAGGVGGAVARSLPAAVLHGRSILPSRNIPRRATGLNGRSRSTRGKSGHASSTARAGGGGRDAGGDRAGAARRAGDDPGHAETRQTWTRCCGSRGNRAR